jgi:hypothetical protein
LNLPTPASADNFTKELEHMKTLMIAGVVPFFNTLAMLADLPKEEQIMLFAKFKKAVHGCESAACLVLVTHTMNDVLKAHLVEASNRNFVSPEARSESPLRENSKPPLTRPESEPVKK